MMLTRIIEWKFFPLLCSSLRFNRYSIETVLNEYEQMRNRMVKFLSKFQVIPLRLPMLI